MPYQPYQSTWQNPYLQQIQQPQYSPVVPSVTTPYTQPSQYQQQPMAQQMSGVVKVDGPDEAMNSSSGYTTDTYGSQGYMPEPMGYDMARTYGRSGYRDSMGRYATRPSNMGYDGMRYGYDMQGLREAMSTASPEEREKMMREMRTMLGM